jgi:hypothetical protein
MPINRIKRWWFTPAAKGSLIVSWAVTASLGVYCIQISYDAKLNYRANSFLVRHLHSESRRADMEEERSSELYKAVVETVNKEASATVAHKKSLQACTETKDELQGTVVNFSGELSRERARNDLLHKRNQGLVTELIGVRSDLAEARKEKKLLQEELVKLRKIVQKFDGV